MEALGVKIQIKDLPWAGRLTRQRRTRLAALWAHYQNFKAVSQRRGVLVPLTLAAKLMRVSKQAIWELVRREVVEPLELDGHYLIPSDFIELYATNCERGRPWQVLKLRRCGALKRPASSGSGSEAAAMNPRRLWKDYREMQGAMTKLGVWVPIGFAAKLLNTHATRTAVLIKKGCLEGLRVSGLD